MRRSIMGIVAFAGVLLAPFSMPAHAGPGTWTTQGPWGGSAFKVAVHPQNASRIYAIGQGGMFRSTDGGTSWQRAENGLPAGIRWVGRFWVAPNNGDVLYLYLRRIEPTGLDLFFRSTDGAQRWQRINYNLPPGALFRTLAIDALDSNRLAIVTNVAGAAAVSRSFDGGATFSALPIGSGYPASPRTTNGFAWHGSRMLAGISNDPVAMLPAQVFISTNDGATWTAGGTLAGGTYVDVPALTTAPSSPITAVQVYAIANNGTTNVGQWSSNGGSSWVQRSGLVNAPWVSPVAPNILLQIASVFSGETFDTQVESSTDNAGLFTVRTSLSLPQFSAVSAPAGYNSGSNQVFYTASISSGLYRTNNNGSTMVPINQGFGSVSVHALASPAGSPLVIYAGQEDGIVRSHAMFRSINGGVSWAPMDLSTVRAAFIKDIAIDRSAPTRIYAVGGSTINVTLTNSGIYRSVDGGTTWTILGTGLPSGGAQRPIGAVNRFVLDPRSCPTPPPTGPCTGTGGGSFPLRTGYVVADGQNVGGGDALIVYKSTNLDVGTPSFSAANVGLTQPPNGSNNFLRGRALVIDPSNTQVLYLGTEIAFSTGAAPAGNYLNGVFKSTNGGASWVHASNGLPQWSPTNTTKLNVFALAIDPTNPNILYAAVARNGVERASDASIYKTTNGGASWVEVGQGLVGASIRSLVIDPNNPQIVYAAGTGTLTHPGGVFRTVNGGATWNSRSIGLPADAVYALLIDAANTNPQRVLAGTNAGVWEITQIPDGDRDASNTPIEDGAPNGGDGNGDGILDSIQSSVASVTGPILPLPDPPAIASPKGRSNYISMGGGVVTLQGTSAHGKGSCTQLNDAQAFDPVIYPDDPMTNGELHRYPFGIISVSLPNCSSTTLQIRFHDASFDTVEWRWRNYGPTTPGNDGTLTWYNYSSNATLINPQTWAVTVTAGALGSWRSDPGSILFRGGPAYIGDRLFRDGFEDP